VDKLVIEHEELLRGGDKVYHIYVPRSGMIIFGYILESLEGWAYYTTIDVERSILYVEVMRDYVGDFGRLLERLIFNHTTTSSNLGGEEIT
jgi:hypothetical protein